MSVCTAFAETPAEVSDLICPACEYEWEAETFDQAVTLAECDVYRRTGE